MVLYKYRRLPPSPLLGTLLAGSLGWAGRRQGLGLDSECSLPQWVSKGAFAPMRSPLLIHSMFLSTCDSLSTVTNTGDQKQFKNKNAKPLFTGKRPSSGEGGEEEINSGCRSPLSFRTGQKREMGSRENLPVRTGWPWKPSQRR